MPQEQQTQAIVDAQRMDAKKAENERTALRSDLTEECRRRKECHKSTSKRIDSLEGALRSVKQSVDSLEWRSSRRAMIDPETGANLDAEDVLERLDKKANRFEVAKLEREATEMGKTVQKLFLHTRKMQELWEVTDDMDEGRDNCLVGAKCLSCNRHAEQAKVCGLGADLDLFLTDRQKAAISNMKHVTKRDANKAARLPSLEHTVQSLVPHRVTPRLKHPPLPPFLSPEDIERRQALIHAKQLSLLHPHADRSKSMPALDNRASKQVKLPPGPGATQTLTNWVAWRKSG